jgi:WD40 repeat protein
MTLRHDVHVGSLSLSPDNSLLAVGGQNSDIYIWSLKDQKLVRSFYNPDGSQPQLEECSKAVFDINWSADGMLIAAGFEKSVVMLDMRKILSEPVTALKSS